MENSLPRSTASWHSAVAGHRLDEPLLRKNRSLYRAIPSTESSAGAVWWGKFAGNVRFWCQDKQGFKKPHEAYVADDGEMRRLFAKEDVAFVWRPEKASYADIEELYRTLGVPFLSESVHIECLDTSP